MIRPSPERRDHVAPLVRQQQDPDRQQEDPSDRREHAHMFAHEGQRPGCATDAVLPDLMRSKMAHVEELS